MLVVKVLIIFCVDGYYFLCWWLRFLLFSVLMVEVLIIFSVDGYYFLCWWLRF